MITPAFRYLRLRYFLGLNIEELLSVAEELDLPFLCLGGNLTSVSGSDLAKVLTGTPRLVDVEEDDDRDISPSLALDIDLTPAAYVERHGLTQHYRMDGQGLVVDATLLWSRSDTRTAICARSLRGEGAYEISQALEETPGVKVPPEVILVFLDLFWDLTGLTTSQVLGLLGSGSPLSDVPRAARDVSQPLLSKLGLVEEEASDLAIIRTIKRNVQEGLWEIQNQAGILGKTKDLKELTEVFHHVVNIEERVISREEERLALSEESRSRSAISILDVQAIERYESHLLPEVTRTQRLMEVERAAKNQLIDSAVARELVAKIEAGEDIGTGIRDLLTKLHESGTEGGGPPREEDEFV